MGGRAWIVFNRVRSVLEVGWKEVDCDLTCGMGHGGVGVWSLRDGKNTLACKVSGL